MAVIAVVDDEADACRLIRRLLSALGHDIEAFTEAEQALRWLDDHVPDLILLDIKLRGTDGLSLLEYVRKQQPSTKVIVMTGHPSAETANKALELGIEDYLVKPLEIDELEERVNKTLGLIL